MTNSKPITLPKLYTCSKHLVPDCLQFLQIGIYEMDKLATAVLEVKTQIEIRNLTL